MNEDLEKATEELSEAFEDVREDLGRVFVAFEDLRGAGPADDINQLLETLEDTVKDVRTRGLVGSGANKHKRARERWLKLKAQP